MLPALLSLLVAAAPGPAPAPASPDGDPRVAVLAAMTAELSRSTERLWLKGYEAPFFVSYQVGPSAPRRSEVSSVPDESNS